MRKSLFVMAISVILLAACVPGQNPVDTQAQVNTAVAQTMEAQQQIEGFVAQTVSAQIPASTATAEFTPTVAPTFFKQITETPFPSITPSAQAPITQPPIIQPDDVILPTATQQAYSCYVINRSPEPLGEIKGGSHFDIRWVVVNTGQKTWEAGTDVKYSSGSKMTKATVVEIPKAMKPQDSYTIVLDAIAPTQEGRQEMTWIVQGQYCYARVIIIVK